MYLLLTVIFCIVALSEGDNHEKYQYQDHHHHDHHHHDHHHHDHDHDHHDHYHSCFPHSWRTLCERERNTQQRLATFDPNEYVVQCLHQGTYAPIQCNAGCGLCWCVDEDGRRLIGSEFKRSEMPPAICLSVCSHPPDYGVCVGHMEAYYYDNGYCKPFDYSTCGGNHNLFYTYGECKGTCLPPDDACSEIVDPGPCKAAIPAYYYDNDLRQCREFHYGGCYGNHNRFSTRAECETICAPKDPCQDVVCYHGAECQVIEDKGVCVCPPTQCGKHKTELVCGSDSITYLNLCSLELARCIKSKTITMEYKGPCADCKPAVVETKQLRCPIPQVCISSCMHDGDCKGHDKCCSNGCTRQCDHAHYKNGTIHCPTIPSCHGDLDNPIKCLHDGECSGTTICCPSGLSGTSCVEPDIVTIEHRD